MPEPNLLYYGDNLDILREYLGDESVDLVYLDPPFKSSVDYNVLFADHGTQSAAQIKAFEDTWHWDEAAAYDYAQTVERGGDVARALRAFQTLIPKSDMLAYLAMMAPRLVELHRVMKPTASLYLHCDSTASHYLKLLLDSVFEPVNFRSEIVWHYKKFEMRRMGRYTKNSDRLLFYVKDAKAGYTFTPPVTKLDVPKSYKRKGWSSELQRIVNKRDDDGNLIYDSYTDEKVDDVWDIPFIGATAKERLGYPTQKPEALLARVIEASSNPGDVVLDPFCGCGTAVAAAQRLNRRWVGIDITHLAINLIKHRLASAHGPAIRSTYEVIGEPTDLEGARQLAADNDRLQFQAWALGLVNARVTGSNKPGSDQGIDGRLYFHDEGPSGKSKLIVISVKSGGVGVKDVRELIAVMQRESAQICALITLQEPTAPMRSEAAGTGFYQSPAIDVRCPRVQVLTIEGLLAGTQRLEYPSPQGNVTFRRAPRAKTGTGKQPDLAL